MTNYQNSKTKKMLRFFSKSLNQLDRFLIDKCSSDYRLNKKERQIFNEEADIAIRKIFRRQSVNCFDHLEFEAKFVKVNEFPFDIDKVAKTDEEMRKFYSNPEVACLNWADIFFNHKYQIWNPSEDVMFQKIIGRYRDSSKNITKASVLKYLYTQKSEHYYVLGIEFFTWLKRAFGNHPPRLLLPKRLLYYLPGSLIRGKNKRWAVPSMAFYGEDEAYAGLSAIYGDSLGQNYWGDNIRVLLVPKRSL